jgi:hypothetical protein
MILLLHCQMALAVESGRFEIVPRQQVSHLLLKCTTFGYGTVLMAACARQGCSAIHHHHHHYHHHHMSNACTSLPELQTAIVNYK